MNVSRRDADPAAAMRVLAIARRNHTRAVRPDQTSLPAFQRPFDFDHIVNWNAFGNTHNKLEAGIDSFQNGIRREGRRHKNGRRSRTGLLHGFGDGVEDGDLVFEPLTPFARRDTGYNLSAIGEAELSVPGAERAGDALNKD